MRIPSALIRNQNEIIYFQQETKLFPCKTTSSEVHFAGTFRLQSRTIEFK